MDGTAAINFNLEALRQILAGLFAMAGPAFTSPLWGGRREASGGGRDAEETPTRRSGDRRPPHKGEVKPAPTLPRHLRLAILRLLRPAESAARRLIIASARGLTVTLPPPRNRKPKPATAEPFLRRFGIAVIASPVDRIHPRGGGGLGIAPPHPEAPASGVSRRTALPLFDPPRRIRASPAIRTVPAYAAPRISFPGVTITRHPDARAPRVPSPEDAIDATRLTQRLATLAAALDDLPAQAKRFALWQARRQRAAQSPSHLWGGVRGGGNLVGASAANNTATPRPRRISPLRPGRPPGGRLARFDPSAYRGATGAQRRNSPRAIREIDEVLAHAHALALCALERPDTS